MAVVINEFEVVPEATSNTPAPGGEQGSASAPPPVPDVTRALRRAHDRAIRVRAY
jgi:hypothetical protein